MSQTTIMRCQCGQVECRGSGKPFLAAVCYCDDCQEAAKQVAASGKGPAVAEPDGGTALCLIRDDRFAIVKGGEHLRPHRLRPETSTSRMVASCCDSAMFLDFSDGRFWKSAMINRIDGAKPPIEMRLMTRYRSSPMPWPDDAPRHAGFPLSPLLRIARQWLAMKFSPHQQ